MNQSEIHNAFIRAIFDITRKAARERGYAGEQIIETGIPLSFEIEEALMEIAGNDGKAESPHGLADGISLRDCFAAQALERFLAGSMRPPGTKGDATYSQFAQASYAMADAMLKARES